MRKLIVLSFISLDGVMQSPGSPDEDPSGGFTSGGWLAPHSDDVLNKAMEKDMKPADLLLGRKTFEIWEAYWPKHAAMWPGINEVTKYVASGSRITSDWENSVFLENVEDIKALKNSDGGDIQVWGSSRLVQSLLEHDLVDELRLKIFPITLGKGKRLFDTGPIPAAFTLTESLVTSKGVMIANYARAGALEFGMAGRG